MADLFNLDAEILDDQDPQEAPEEAEGGEWNAEDAEEVFPDTATQETTATATTAASFIPDRVDLEDIAAKATLEDLDYTYLHHAWMQECQSPELLPFPADLIERIRERLDQAGDDQAAPQTGNEGLDVLLTSLLTIDSDRMAFLLADLLKQRLHKIQTHPFHMATERAESMSPQEAHFCKEYQVLLQHHLEQTVTQHFPDRENWRTIPHDAPDFEHSYCFAYCIDNVKIQRSQGDTGQQAAGNRIIVRYNKIRDLVLEGKMRLL